MLPSLARMVTGVVGEAGRQLGRSCNMMTVALICALSLVIHNSCCLAAERTYDELLPPPPPPAELQPYVVAPHAETTRHLVVDHLPQTAGMAAVSSARIDSSDNRISNDAKQEDPIRNRLYLDKRYGINMFHAPSCMGLGVKCHPLLPGQCSGPCRPGRTVKGCRRLKNKGFTCIQMRLNP